MKSFALAFTLGLAASSVIAAPLPSPTQIIQKEGRFAFTDGSSFYLFKRDGGFTSGPMSMSGRTIEGRWRGQGDDFTIEGQWGWDNGLSASNDLRRLTLSVYPEGVEPKSKSQIISGMAIPVKMYRCYFVVNELVRLPQPKQSENLPQQH